MRIAVLTVSDSRSLADDSSGDYLVKALAASGTVVSDCLCLTLQKQDGLCDHFGNRDSTL
jgi:molybdopterin biosynthesis enzyme MoaB